jgi:hypothetical protein
LVRRRPGLPPDRVARGRRGRDRRSGEDAEARAAVAILEDGGWVWCLPAGVEIDGAPRREAWELVP